LGPLLASEHQQFGVDSQQLGSDLFELSPGLNARTNGVEPVGRDRFDPLFAGGHEGESGERMAVAFSAVARGFTTAAIGNRERARKGILRKMQARQQKVGAAAEAGRFRTASGRDDAPLHLIVIIQSDTDEINTLQKCS
jgi:hypothetical protein